MKRHELHPGNYPGPRASIVPRMLETQNTSASQANMVESATDYLL